MVSISSHSRKGKKTHSAASWLISSLPPPPFQTFSFPPRLNSLAPPAGDRLEWRCIPSQIKEEMLVPLDPLRKLKLESDLGIYAYMKRVVYHTLLFRWQRRVHASKRWREKHFTLGLSSVSIRWIDSLLLPAGTWIFLWHQQVRGAGPLNTSAQLETPHVTNHCSGIERLLQRRNTRIHQQQNLMSSFTFCS